MAAPPNFDWSAPAILAEVDAILAQTTRVWNLVGEIPLENVTFENTILPTAQDENEHLRRYYVVGWFASVTSNDEIRAASNEARKKVLAFRKSLWEREDIAEAVLEIWSDQQKGSRLGAENMIYLNVLRQKFVDSGLALKDPKSVSRLADLEREIKESGSEYMQALDGKQGLWMTLDELQGVPESAVLRWEADQDKRFVPLKAATFELLLDHADREETRKKFEIAFDNRVKDTNPALLHRILVLRDEQARLLGYKHYADWLAVTRMMCPDRAVAFLEDAAKVLSGPVKSRIDAFLGIKGSQPRENGSPTSQLDKIYTWDSYYYERLCRQQEYAVDEAAIQQYFPFDQVLDRVLQIQGAAFGFKFEKVNAQYPRDVWHEDVEMYKVWKEEGQKEFAGHFYVDAYARDFKFGHRVSTYCLANAHLADDGSRVYPNSIYLANYAKPSSPGESVLLTFRDVVSCFHEIGHSFHNFSKTTKFWVLATVARDFVETPSILLEHFFWHMAVIRFLSGRRTADGEEEKLPDRIIEQLISSRFAGDIMAKSRLVRDGLADLHMHMPENHEEVVDMDPVRYYNCMRREICQLAGPEDAGMDQDSSKAISRFRYPILYAASYYAYFLAGAISYDLFETKFRPLMPATDAVTLEQLINAELKKESKRVYKSAEMKWGRVSRQHYFKTTQTTQHTARGCNSCNSCNSCNYFNLNIFATAAISSTFSPAPTMEASRQPIQNNDYHTATLTPRAVACGILLGIVVCLANMYFGLQAGMVSPMPMQSALLGFAIFQSIRPRLSKALTPAETTLIEVIAGSLGLAPFTLGLTSFIPALEFLTNPEENGPFKFTNGQLLLWAMATCGLGIIAAVPFRRLLILRESLPYPSATATGALIGILFKRPAIIARAKQTQMRPCASRVSHISTVYGERDEADPGGDTERLLGENSRHGEDQGLGRDANRPALRMLLYALVASLSFGFIAYFLPILHRVPIFGLNAASHWMWAFDLSPAYIGYGIIIGPSINAYVLIGAVVGWGILSPVAKHRGWAPGPMTDFENGPRGWILCVGLGFILGDTIVAVGWICSKSFICCARRWVSNIVQRKQLSSSRDQRDGTETPLLRESPSAVNTVNKTTIAQDDGWPKSSLITTGLVGWIGAALLLLYFISIPTAFGHLTSVPATLLAVLLIPLAGFISMRSMGETDNGASVAIGRFSQFAIARLFSFSGTKFTSANLLLGGAIESGASQAAQQMGNLKIASITQTAPRAVMYAQMIGSYVGAFIAIFFYKLYSYLDRIPSEEFSIPDAHLYITTSRFIRWQGLPPGVTGFVIGSFALGTVLGVLRVLSLKHWWRCLVPSGIAIAIGMYIVPGISLARALGGIISLTATRRYGLDNFTMICCATGLILGQGLFSSLSLLFDALHVPNFGG